MKLRIDLDLSYPVAPEQVALTIAALAMRLSLRMEKADAYSFQLYDAERIQRGEVDLIPTLQETTYDIAQ